MTIIKDKNLEMNSHHKQIGLGNNDWSLLYSQQDSRASDEDLRLTVVHLVVAFVSKLRETGPL